MKYVNLTMEKMAKKIELLEKENEELKGLLNTLSDDRPKIYKKNKELKEQIKQIKEENEELKNKSFNDFEQLKEYILKIKKLKEIALEIIEKEMIFPYQESELKGTLQRRVKNYKQKINNIGE